ncbi:sulfatase-like hydrolase/transferase, partial [Arthrospira platensis SPKY1]|nr:sulfatase-like hydrolase/transferase [Arthrospira platensis SPKY1]
MLPEDVTLAEVLREAGFVTGIIGKWGLGEPDTTGIPNLQGFDEWYGLLNQHQAHSHFPRYLWRNQTREFLPGNSGTTQNFAVEAHYVQDLFLDFTLDFIE